MSYTISIDVGGTFTDLVLADENGEMTVAKTPTVPGETWKGIIAALNLAAEECNLSLNEFLAQSTSITYSGTTPLNAIITGNTAKTGLICTKGFRDVLLSREGPKKDSTYVFPEYPEPIIPRYLTLPVAERINAEGGVELPLDETDVRTAVQQFKEYKIEALAVCLIWSIANPIHEQRVGEIFNEEWPDLPVVLSHQLNPIIREYRRTSSSAINASLLPIMAEDIRQVDEWLKQQGFSGTLLIGSGSGGVLTPEEASLRPIYTVGSGPALAPVAGRYYAKNDLGADQAIVLDMGGTSFDVSLVRDGLIPLSREVAVKDEILGINQVDVRSIGSGGGSIAWVDDGGMIHVGPQSAGATPGPACYDKGGQRPTVTDANLQLGYLDPQYFLGGRMKLNSGLADEAISAHVGRPLGLNDAEAAHAIYSTVNQDMVAAIQDITIWQGIDPREHPIITGGGAAGMHVVPIAKELGVKKILIPRVAGTLSAAGGLIGDLTSDFSISFPASSMAFNHEMVNNILGMLEMQAQAFLERSGGSDKGELKYFVDARYPYEVWELTIPLRSSRIETSEDVAALVEDFHNAHERIFTIKEPGQSVECGGWSIKATAKTIEISSREYKPGDHDVSAAQVGTRKAFFKELGNYVETLVFRGDRLKPENTIQGPAIIEEATTTIVIPPGACAVIDRYGNYSIDVE